MKVMAFIIYCGMKEVYIYVLIDPRNGKVRYIGKTNCVHRRLTAHCNPARFKGTHKFNWIRSLRKLNLKPSLRIIETCDPINWKTREKWWIRYFTKKGCKLTNHTEGGDGLSFGNSTSFKKGRSAKVVLVFDKLGLVESLPSLKLACDKYGSHVWHVIHKKGKTSKGYTFVYADGFDMRKDLNDLLHWAFVKQPRKPNSGNFVKGQIGTQCKPVEITELSTGAIHIADSAKAAAIYIGDISPGGVQYGCTKNRLIKKKKFKVKYIK